MNPDVEDTRRRSRQRVITRVGTAIAISLLLITAAQVARMRGALIEALLLALGSIIAGTTGITFLFDSGQTDLVKLRAERAEKAEARLEEAPFDQTRVWDAARAKIELYVTQNQAQQRSIFWLTVLVMVAGFALVTIGVGLSMQNRLNPAVLATVAGILINFMGGSFLLIYRSVAGQAQSYIEVLERINAVGMAMQVLDKMGDGQGELREETRAKISIGLLELYGRKPAQSGS